MAAKLSTYQKIMLAGMGVPYWGANAISSLDPCVLGYAEKKGDGVARVLAVFESAFDLNIEVCQKFIDDIMYMLGVPICQQINFDSIGREQLSQVEVVICFGVDSMKNYLQPSSGMAGTCQKKIFSGQNIDVVFTHNIGSLCADICLKKELFQCLCRLKCCL